MKKSVIITIIVSVIVVLLIILSVIFAIFFSKNNLDKKPLSADAFYSLMEDTGYNLTDATNQFSEFDYIKKVYIAGDDGYNFQIEFYEITDETHAQGFFDYNKEILEESKDSISYENTIELKNYSKYILDTTGEYSVVSRIDNTVIYASVLDEYKDIVSNVLDEIGY